MKKDIILSDLDGTIALIDHRLHFVESAGPKNFNKFDSQCIHDTPNIAVIETLKCFFASKYRVVIFSGRKDTYETQTRTWLKDNKVPFHDLFMRKSDDYRPDTAIKNEMIESIDKNRILLVLDDRKKMAKFWRDQGLACFQVQDR